MTEKQITQKEQAPTTAPTSVPEKPVAQNHWPFSSWDRFFDSLMPSSFLRHWREDWPFSPELFAGNANTPRVDVSETETEVRVHAELPGVAKDDLEVFVEPRKLSIRGKTQHEEEKKEETFYRKEIRRGSFSRIVALPADVDPEKVHASFKDGILELAMSKVESAKRRSIPIK